MREILGNLPYSCFVVVLVAMQTERARKAFQEKANTSSEYIHHIFFPLERTGSLTNLAGGMALQLYQRHPRASHVPTVMPQKHSRQDDLPFFVCHIKLSIAVLQEPSQLDRNHDQLQMEQSDLLHLLAFQRSEVFPEDSTSDGKAAMEYEDTLAQFDDMFSYAAGSSWREELAKHPGITPGVTTFTTIELLFRCVFLNFRDQIQTLGKWSLSAQRIGGR